MKRGWERAVRSQASYDAMSPVGARTLPSDIVDKIGKHLRDIYDAVVHEPLPDQFCELLGEIPKRLEHAREHA